MQALTLARFGLKSQERGPFGETGGGYLGMSHNQNLNAWFADDGVTVRPTVSEDQREHSWHMGMRLKAYGYGNDLVAAPPIVSRHVKDNRIEYERSNCRSSIANCRLENDVIASHLPFETTLRTQSVRGDLGILKSAIGNRQLRSGTRTGLKESSRDLPSVLGRSEKVLRLINLCVW